MKIVQEFKKILLESGQSPMEKLMALHLLFLTINEEIMEFWAGVQPSLVLSKLARDEKISIVNFIIIKAQIPDINAQLKLIAEFSSEYVQGETEESAGNPLSDTYSMLFSSIKWLSALDLKKLQENPKKYIMNARVTITHAFLSQTGRGMPLSKLPSARINESFNPFDVSSALRFSSNNVSSSYPSDNTYSGKIPKPLVMKEVKKNELMKKWNI
jgi:hypothetical protein